MNLPGLASSYLRARPLQTTLSLLLLALGAGTIVTLLLVVGQIEARMGRDARALEENVGAPAGASEPVEDHAPPVQKTRAGHAQSAPSRLESRQRAMPSSHPRGWRSLLR